MPTARLIATVTCQADLDSVDSLVGKAEILEVRADLVGDQDADWIRDRFDGELLYTLRSRAEGGCSDVSTATRRRRIVAASATYDLLDLEGHRDLEPEVLQEIPAERRIISWHGGAGTLSELQKIFERLAAQEARYYKMVPSAEQSGQELVPLALLRSRGRSDIIAFASGEIGLWTRHLAARLGAPVLYGSAGTEPGAPGQPSIHQLREDYGLPELVEVDRLFGIVGSPIAHSLSPRLHNRLYRELGISGLYVPFHVDNFGDFWLEVVESGSLLELGFELRGLSVTAPHKAIAVAVAGATSPLAEWINSANTLVFREGVWEAETTDPEGVVGPLAERGVSFSGLIAAVVGAGGAGRAAAASLTRVGAEVVMVNRGIDRGRKAAETLHLPFTPLTEFEPSRYRVVVHATPVGGQGETLPFELGDIGSDTVMVDLVYRHAGPTPLIREAARRGCEVVEGREVLLHQAAPQFHLMTGHQMPLGQAGLILGLEGAE